MAISEEERKKILNQNFPDTVLGYKRPGDVPTDFPYSEHFPQFIAKDKVIYTLTNLIIRQLLSNDKYIKALLERGDKELKALIDAIDNRLANNDLATVTPSYNGLMSAEDKKKLDGIADRANNYVHPNSGVKAGSYKQVSVNAQGHVTGGSNPNTLQGYGIIDAAPLVHGNHVPKLESVNNSRFLRNDNTWQTVTPGNIGAPTRAGTGASGTWDINIKGKATTAGSADIAANSDKLDGYHYQDIINKIAQIMPFPDYDKAYVLESWDKGNRQFTAPENGWIYIWDGNRNQDIASKQLVEDVYPKVTAIGLGQSAITGNFVSDYGDATVHAGAKIIAVSVATQYNGYASPIIPIAKGTAFQVASIEDDGCQVWFIPIKVSTEVTQ